MARIIHRGGSDPPARGSMALMRTAPQLWAEQERRRQMLEKGGVEVTYRRAEAFPPDSRLKHLILGRPAPLEEREPSEWALIVETMLKMWIPRGRSYRSWIAEEGHRVQRILQESPAWVADVGGGVVLGFVVAQASLVHCLFVKTDFRGVGLGLGLLREANVTLPVQVDRATNSWRKWTARHGIDWEFRKET